MTNSPDQRAALNRELERIEEDSLYSSKGHFYAAARWGSLVIWLGIPTALMSGVAGVSALSDFDKHNLVAGLLALAVAGITAVTTFLNPDRKAAIHHSFGNKYSALRNQARVTREVDGPSAKLPDLRKTVDHLAKERDEHNEKAPQIPKWAFKKARKGIEEGEASYAADSE